MKDETARIFTEKLQEISSRQDEQSGDLRNIYLSLDALRMSVESLARSVDALAELVPRAPPDRPTRPDIAHRDTDPSELDAE